MPIRTFSLQQEEAVSVKSAAPTHTVYVFISSILISRLALYVTISLSAPRRFSFVATASLSNRAPSILKTILRTSHPFHECHSHITFRHLITNTSVFSSQSRSHTHTSLLHTTLFAQFVFHTYTSLHSHPNTRQCQPYKSYKDKVFYGQNSRKGESTTTDFGVNY